LLLYFSARQHRRLPRETWRRWVRRPEEAEGEVGEIIRYTQDEVRSLPDIHNRFAEVHASKLPVDRSAGGVPQHPDHRRAADRSAGHGVGMLVTFQSIALGGGQMSEMMSAGISQALFPPEVGLCVALPGLALVYLIKRKRRSTRRSSPDWRVPRCSISGATSWSRRSRSRRGRKRWRRWERAGASLARAFRSQQSRSHGTANTSDARAA
jgi:biopolymer transport protein ExbB